MKKLLFLALMAVTMVSCHKDTLSEAYVRQILHEQGVQDSDIKSIVSEKSDSLMTPLTLTGFGELEITKALNSFLNKEISADSTQSVFDINNSRHDAIMRTWQYKSETIRDSLKQVYPSEFRKVEKVVITYNSGDTKTVKILFDNDNKPCMTEAEVGQKLDEFKDKMLEQYNRFLQYKY